MFEVMKYKNVDGKILTHEIYLRDETIYVISFGGRKAGTVAMYDTVEEARKSISDNMSARGAVRVRDPAK